MTDSSVGVSAYTLTSALGVGLPGLRASLADDRTGLVPINQVEWLDCDVPCFVGAVPEAASARVAPEWQSRNNQLIELALAQDGIEEQVRAAVESFGATRVAVVMGTSTSSIDRTEAAYRHRDEEGLFPREYLQPRTHNPHAPGDYVAARLGLQGPAVTISAACASSAKVFATAQRWLNQGLADAVLVGGADSLCLSVIYGFHSLQLVDAEPCRPFSADRAGISLGEAAGFVLLTREASALRLDGVGESCDAYHMSSAHPEGLGAELAMQRALQASGLELADVDYLNLHGTGTRANDETEGGVVARLARGELLASATKGWTGHTLGAAGIVESVMCLDALATGVLAGTANTTAAEADFDLLLRNTRTSIKRAMSNSFGFGGNNCSVVFSAS